MIKVQEIIQYALELDNLKKESCTFDSRLLNLKLYIMRLFTVIADNSIRLRIYAESKYHALEKAMYSYPKFNTFQYNNLVRTRS